MLKRVTAKILFKSKGKINIFLYVWKVLTLPPFLGSLTLSRHLLETVGAVDFIILVTSIHAKIYALQKEETPSLCKILIK